MDLPATFHYATPNNGAHYIYLAPEGVLLGGTRDYRKLPGVDRRGGSSYGIWYGDVPKSRHEFSAAPKWLCDPIEDKVGSSFDGDLETWLSTLEDGEPTEKVLAAIERIPTEPFDHVGLVERQWELVRLAAEGHTGVSDALELLRDAWLTPPWDTADYRYDYDSGLSTAVAKAGAEDAEIASLPTYKDALSALTIDPEPILFGTKPKGHYFVALKALIASGLDDANIASLLWNAPATKPYARDWGYPYLAEQIAKMRAEPPAPVSTNPTLDESTEVYAQPDGLTLLTPNERAATSEQFSFIETYLDWANTKVNVLNKPYHIANALTILSCTLGSSGFIDNVVDVMNLNLFTIALGPSSSGKSQSLSLRRKILSTYFAGDRGYNLGADASIQGLHKALLARDGQVSLFNSDEAHGVFVQLLEQKWSAGLIQKITNWYEGWVEPMIRVGDKKDEAGQTANTIFNMSLFGVETEVVQVLTEDMFKSGFLARVIWFVGEPSVKDDSRYLERRGTGIKTDEDTDETAATLVNALVHIQRSFEGRRVAIGATDEALARMTMNRKAMDTLLASHPNRPVIEPSIIRLGDNISKVSALLAMAEGSQTVRLHHVLKTLELAETWLANLVSVSAQISASTFQRDCDTLEAYISSQGGSVAATKLYNRFRNMGTGDPRDFEMRTDSLVKQGRINRLEANKSKGVQFEINTKSE